MSAKQIITPALRAAVHVRSAAVAPALTTAAASHLSSAAAGGQITLPDLAYDYAALEPSVSAETMEIHHSKHHNTFVTNLNVVREKLDAAVAAGDVSGIIGLQGALKFNGGGHLNHTLFWENLCPAGSAGNAFPASGPLAEAVAARFGDYAAMKKEVSAMTVAVQGSGWGWLGLDTKTGRIEPTTCPNQDPLQATTGLVPLLGIDVWEHAYYVDYRNVRPDYVNAIWDIVNWSKVEERLTAAQ